MANNRDRGPTTRPVKSKIARIDDQDAVATGSTGRRRIARECLVLDPLHFVAATARAHWRCIHWLQSWRNRAGGTFVMIYSVRRIISFAVFERNFSLKIEELIGVECLKAILEYKGKILLEFDFPDDMETGRVHM